MNDDSIVKIMQALDLDYSKAILSTMQFGQSIESLNKQLTGMKAIAIQNAKDINNAFSSQLGQVPGNKSIVDQYGNAFKIAKTEANKMKSTLKDNIEIMKQSTLEQMKAQAATIQQKVNSKNLSQEYSVQAKAIKQQTDELINRLRLEGQLTAEEVKQTKEMQEQLNILKAQVTTDVAGQSPNILDSEFQRRVQWFATGGVFYGMTNAAKSAVSTIKEVEMGMVELARIMDDPTFNFEQYRENLFQLGVDYGQTFENVQDIALRWAQAGYNVADSLRLTETALLALNTAELDAANATEAMVGIMAQWQLQAGDLELVIDKINKTADDYTVSSQDLVDGLLRSSSAARNMNMSIEETISLLTVMREASGRTGQEVGNALNSILSYIQRPKSIDTLEDMGIQVFSDKAKTQFRNAMDIFKDVAANWKNASDTIKDGFVAAADDAGLFSEELATALGLQGEWNDLQKRDIAQASAGVYRRNYYIGMIERLANTQGILNNMMDAEGYSMRENAKTMDTLEKKVESFKASLERLAVAMGDAGYLEIMKDIVDAGTGLLEAFNNIDEGTQKAIISFTTMFGLLKAGEKALSFMGVSYGSLSKQAKDATATIGGFTLSLNGWITVAQLAVSIGFAAYNAWKKQQEAQKRAIETSQASIKAYQDEISQLERLSNEYENISSKTDATETEKSRLVEIQKELASTFPELITGFDTEGNAMADNANATRNLIEAKKELIAQELEALNILAQGRIPELKEEISETEDRINELTNKLRSGDTKETIWISHKDGISEVRDMSEKYAKEVIELSAKLKDMRGELSDLTGIVKQYDDAMVLQNGTLKEAKKQLNMLTDAELQEMKVIKELSTESKDANIQRLEKDKEYTLAMIENTKARIMAMQSEMNALLGLRKEHIGSVVEKVDNKSNMAINPLTGLPSIKGLLFEELIPKQQDELKELNSNLKLIEQAYNNISSIQASGGSGSPGTDSKSKSKDGKYENKQLQEALKLLEHRKKISEETQASIKSEIAELNRINSLYVKTADERMDMAERIYSAEKRLRDRTLQDSINWINEKKNLNELSTEEEIAAWERVRKNQSNNIEAVKQATLNLYKLRNQVMTDSFSREENSIKHLTKLGLLSVDEQIKKYRELYEVKASTLSEEQSRVENLFDLYKKQISDQQRTIKEAHDKRIEQIEEEAKKKKSIHEDEIKAIEKELGLLNRQEDEYDHDKKMADLKEQLAYWQVRTSEDARKKVSELLKQIDEAEHKREVDLKKQSLEDKKKVLQDEVKSVEDTAREEREKLDKSYKQIEIAFDEHSINLIALASTMSQGMFEEFQKNYLIPLENALRDGNYDSIGSIVDGINDYGNSLSDYGDRYSQDKYSKHDWGMTDADYLRFQSNGEKWKELQRQGFSHSNNAEMQRLQAENDRLRIKYGRDPNLGEYPEFHTGAKTLSYGVAMFKPGELVFPPDLSTRLETLIDVLYQRPMSQSSSSLTDNRKEIKIDKLLNIERNYMEDDIDSEILVRQLQRSLTSL
jgi:TP901 family phage tail tape measure protein